jgi:competence protein ComFC
MFERNVSLFPYRGAAKRAVQAYKFHGASTLARFFAAGLTDLRSTVAPEAPVVPVPPRPGRRSLGRRSDQVTRIVSIMQRRHRVPVMRMLKRDGGRAQKELDYEERLRNLKGRFRLCSTAPPLIGLVVLLDDVFTTGATASECARVLKDGGATSVIVLTLAVD